MFAFRYSYWGKARILQDDGVMCAMFGCVCYSYCGKALFCRMMGLRVHSLVMCVIVIEEKHYFAG